MKDKKSLRGSALLLLTAFIWGVAFAEQAKAMEFCGPFTFNGARSFVAAAVLLLLWALRGCPMPSGVPLKKQLGGAALCGVALFCASTLQQVALQFTSAGKAGFLTALYIVLVPLAGLFLHKRPSAAVWIAVVLATCGLYLLCGGSDFALGKAELCLLGCAACFAVQILLLDRFAVQIDPILLCGVQFAVVGLGSLPLLFTAETPSFAQLRLAMEPLLFLGLLSGAVGYTLQIVGQRDVDPTLASLLMSFESVFSVLGGAVLLQQHLSRAEIGGCVPMFAAIILAQLPMKKNPLKKSKKTKEKHGKTVEF